MKILLIEDNPGDARLIREALAQAGDPAMQVEWVDRLAKGMERAAGGGFDVGILDLSLPDSRGLESFQRLHGHVPRLPVVVLTGLDDEELALKAVGDGAQDYLVKGAVKAAALTRVLRFAIERNKAAAGAAGRRAPSKIIGFMGAKGGCGTTTVVLNVAAALTLQGESVVCVEMSPYRSGFSLQLRSSPRRDLGDLLKLDADRINSTELQSRLVSSDFGAQLLFAPQDAYEATDPERVRLEAVLRAASDLAAFVLVDLASVPSCMHQACARMCDPFLLVMERDAMGVAAGKNALPMLAFWGLEKDCLGAILVIKNAMTAYVPSSLVRTELGFPVVGAIPPATEALAASYRQGTPLLVSDNESLPADSLRLLAQRLAAPVLVEMQG